MTQHAHARRSDTYPPIRGRADHAASQRKAIHQRGCASHQHGVQQPSDSRISGAYDLRMLPLAITVWMLAALHATVIQSAAEINGSDTSGLSSLLDSLHSERSISFNAVTTGACVGCAALMGIVLTIIIVHRRGHSRARLMRALPTCVLMLVAGFVVLVAAELSTRVSAADNPLIAAHTSSMRITAMIRIDDPWQHSTRRGYDFMAQATVTAYHHDRVSNAAAISTMVFIHKDNAHAQRGGTYLMSGELSQSAWDDDALWFACNTVEAMQHAPPMHWRLVNLLYERFAHITSALSDEGRLLVTGLTLGTLSEILVSSDNVPESHPLDENLIQHSKQQFRTAGIIHLMAVSGGHFALIAIVCRWVRAVCKLPRVLVAILHSLLSVGLSWLVFPSDSVLRAVVSAASLASLAIAIGRRTQCVNQLSWVIIVTLTMNPALSVSFAFALSCAAVLGIGLFAEPFTAWMQQLMPRLWAQAIAVTICAQMFTLPIQIVLQPEISILSIPANILVAPFASFATVCGLLAVLVSWCAPQLAWALVWVASCATAIIHRWAAICSQPQWARMPWAQGIGGACLAVAAEVLIVIFCFLIRWMIRTIAHSRIHTEQEFTHYGGQAFQPSRLDSVIRWWRSSLELLNLP